VLEVLLYCDDFSAEISRGALWFAWGESWARELGRLLEDAPGLPTPSRFIRLPHADAAATEQRVADAQRVFAEQSARRSAAITDARERWSPAAAGNPRRLCVVARSRFRLWNDEGHALHAALEDGGIDLHRFDPDAPAGCSPLAFAVAARDSDAVVAADLARADAPGLAHPEMPWVTWVTTPRIPAFAAAGPNDRLLVADPTWRDAATRAGWPPERVGVAPWPAVTAHAEPPSSQGLALVADTCGLNAPESLAEFSSHGLLWDTLREQVLRDPFGVPASVEPWIRAAARRNGIAAETLHLQTFVSQLVIPAYVQGLASVLIAAGVPLMLHGAGWADLSPFRAAAAGPVKCRAQLAEIARATAGLVHPLPTPGAHPVETLGRPVVRAAGQTRWSFLNEVTRVLKGSVPSNRCEPPLSAYLLRATLGEVLVRRLPLP
jgi:hypothetical protein